MTKKEFTQKCSFQAYAGHKVKINAIFFDWKSGDIDDKYFAGFKYMVKANVRDITQKELFNMFYEWIAKGTKLDYYVDYKFAENDLQRFKIPLSI